jgi:hypothetical protein
MNEMDNLRPAQLISSVHPLFLYIVRKALRDLLGNDCRRFTDRLLCGTSSRNDSTIVIGELNSPREQGDTVDAMQHESRLNTSEMCVYIQAWLQ